ncbi:MAG: hypothetical protein WCX93_08775, partial [Burkholderiaceae bacterium]
AACIPGIGRSAALQMLAIATAITALCALLPIPTRGADLPFELFRASLKTQSNRRNKTFDGTCFITYFNY